MASNYLSFEEVIDELGIDEEELKRLISQGELRGFRDGMSMKFKRSDVMKLSQGRQTEPTIILTESDNDLEFPESSEELVLEDSSTDDTVLNINDFSESSVGSSDELLIGSSDDLLIAPSGDSEESIATVEAPSLKESGSSSYIEFYESSEEDDTGALMEVGASSDEGGTETFELIDDSEESSVALVEESTDSTDSGEFIMEESAELSEENIAPRSSMSGRAHRSSKRIMAAAAMQLKTHHIAWTILLLLAAILLFIPTAIQLNAVKGTEADWVISLAKNFNGLTETFYKTFGGK
ncbi:MAG: DNA-binding protein [Planctomycetota bacterium]|nr:MAG: DNA-binding protein [Planctomycetota bacterium]